MIKVALRGPYNTLSCGAHCRAALLDVMLELRPSQITRPAPDLLNFLNVQFIILFFSFGGCLENPFAFKDCSR